LRLGYRHSSLKRHVILSETYIIEVSSQAAGIIVRDRAGFRFFAASRQFSRLEGQLFRSAREAERVATRFVEARSPKAA
jgi:hypothetical protein